MLRNYNISDMFLGVGGVRFSKMCSPRSAGNKKPPEMFGIPACLDLIDYTMVLTISTYKFDATSTPDALKRAPDLF